MRDISIRKFHKILDQRKEELQMVIRNNEQILKEQLSPEDKSESSLDTNHPADMVASDPDYEKEIQIIRRERAELALVTSALARIDLGTYGRCEACQEEIPLGRLEAVPYTKYCISCKEDRDLAARETQKVHDVENLGQ